MDSENKLKSILEAARLLAGTRPTGFHMAALLDKITGSLDYNKTLPQQILAAINRAADLQRTRSRLTGRFAAELLKDRDVILTHCFPGQGLLYMLLYAMEQGKGVEVISCETRPYLQGARLTAWSVSELGVPVTLISDNMAAYCMNSGMVSKVFTAADRITTDGTVANKVGTLQLAVVADYCHIPFYVLGYGGPDRKSTGAQDIPIEMRDPEEVLCFRGTRITGGKVNGFYPAFDITPARFVKGIVTDRGIFSPADINSYWSAAKCDESGFKN
jgi:methylthioribose-1-phosphate isomerase